jgi:tetrahydromethanopterin S-methyltransferase subunit A
MINPGFVIATVAMGAVGAAITFFPDIAPRAINRYYRLIGMKSRVVTEDYRKLRVRLAGIVMMAMVAWMLYQVIHSGK